ncbi:rac GTPase-activating protein 1 [Hyla sarda]|uniref:rac GTPase-activating protein 1 n=1 Tax=Hyla sarda TaxID=327740 RepID=UPI0024C27C4F|nr:rac GTPase-activating protein 1 [Hyla sarda]XP_056411348.1 rac GTPase-activating protein 1 [Hyla sarda]XP_056411349.1 rac GTPase-activating protein 1 [Hyla sarda]
MATTVLNVRNVFDQLIRLVDGVNEGIEPQFFQLARNFEDFRRKWQKTEQELVKSREMLMKTETERSALEVKLKHARNQVDVEIKRRQRAEADCEKMERQIQLIRELLMSDPSGSIQLSEQQRSALAFLNNKTQMSTDGNGTRRLSTIDESGSILSDISFDKTEDSLDWDSSFVRNVRLKKREKRRSSRQQTEGPPAPSKRTRSIGLAVDPANESIVTKTMVTVPNNGGIIEAVSTIETVPYYTRSHRAGQLQPWNSDSSLMSRQFDDRNETNSCSRTPQNHGIRLHEFVSKTVIKPESCVPCGKRIKFGKISLKCRDCRVVAHPECRERCPLPCIPSSGNTPVRIGEGSLADFVPLTAPMIPLLVVHCVSEIEQRGLHETGLYRISGCDRTVKELKEKFLRGKSVPLLSKVDDIHAVCGFLKDFLRNLKEPLLTFRLNKSFMKAAEITDEGNSIAAIYQVVDELPAPNRDTLAFLMMHLQRVADSPDCKMDITNLAKVFGPTLVGNAVADPDPMTILQDTKRQPKVVERLLSLPADFWNQFMMVENMDPSHIIENTNVFNTPQTPDGKVSMLGPLTTPEQQITKTPSTSSLSQKVRSTIGRSTPKFGSKSKSVTSIARQGNYFASPLLK